MTSQDIIFYRLGSIEAMTKRNNEDINELRRELKESRQESKEAYARLDAKIDAAYARLDAKIDAGQKELRRELKESRQESKEDYARLDAKIDAGDTKLEAGQQKLHAEIKEVNDKLQSLIENTPTRGEMLAIIGIVFGVLAVLITFCSFTAPFLFNHVMNKKEKKEKKSSVSEVKSESAKKIKLYPY